MTREHKLALVVGFGLVLFVGILIADHLAAGRRVNNGPPPALSLVDPPYNLQSTTDTLALVSPPRTLAPREPRPTPAGGVVEIGPNRREVLARPTDSAGSFGPTNDHEPRRHRVRPGERLQDIAQAYYGDPSLWKHIADANRIQDPKRLRAGRDIVIPPARSDAQPPKLREPARTYKVRSGDTLTIIAERFLGRQSRWREIQNLNGLQDALIQPGQILKLPAR